MDMFADNAKGRDTARLYSELEERIMARDQVGASDVFYELVRAGWPRNEIIAEGVRIHAPYTHVPYHERIDDGYPDFINNDHCLLSARATLHLTKLLPGELAMLPMAQTIWYILTGLDIWNQMINEAPGHDLLYEQSPANLDCVTMMLKAGIDPRRIVDVLQIVAAEIVLGTRGVNNFSMPMHCYEYTNALGWFYDTFDHPRRLRLLYIAAEFVNMTAWHQKLTDAFAPAPVHAPGGAARLGADELLARIDTAICSLNGPAGLAWVQAYCDNVSERAALVRTLALGACKLGNDPHNQEIPQNMLEDFAKNESPRRDRLLLACAQHCAAHRKYGDPFEPAQRFGKAMGIALV